MINANLSQFLDTGWFSEATIYYKGFTYWCEGDFDKSREKYMHFFVYKYRSIVYNEKYTKRMIKNGDVVDYSLVLEIFGDSEQDVKEEFLKAKIWDGKSFWEVESELAWFDEL